MRTKVLSALNLSTKHSLHMPKISQKLFWTQNLHWIHAILLEIKIILILLVGGRCSFQFRGGHQRQWCLFRPHSRTMTRNLSLVLSLQDGFDAIFSFCLIYRKNLIGSPWGIQGPLTPVVVHNNYIQLIKYDSIVLQKARSSTSRLDFLHKNVWWLFRLENQKLC